MVNVSGLLCNRMEGTIDNRIKQKKKEFINSKRY